MAIDKKIEILQGLVDRTKKVVFFGGAGVSTESGLKDFRSNDGIYHQNLKISPETILSHEFFYQHPQEFYEFYFKNLFIRDIQPNDAHFWLSDLEKKQRLLGIITQNIDGLHQKAGSKKVFELHGSIHRNYCLKCHKFYSSDDLYRFFPDRIPICQCGGLIKPDVVLYHEPLDQETIVQSIKCLSQADLLIIAGTSLTVYPAAGMVNYFHGKNIVLINKDATTYDQNVQLVINQPVGKVLKQIKIL